MVQRWRVANSIESEVRLRYGRISRVYGPRASPRIEPFGGVDGEIGENEVRARAAEAEQHLHHGPLFIEPSLFCGGLDHGELAGDVVNRDWNVELLFGRG